MEALLKSGTEDPLYAAHCILELRGITDPSDDQFAGALHEAQHRRVVEQLLRSLIEIGGGKMKTW